MQRDLSFDPLSLRCRSLNPCLVPQMQICTSIQQMMMMVLIIICGGGDKDDDDDD